MNTQYKKYVAHWSSSHDGAHVVLMVSDKEINRQDAFAYLMKTGKISGVQIEVSLFDTIEEINIDPLPVITDNLPEKPSQLLRVAINDLQIAEKTPNCKIDMDNWQSELATGMCESVCSVCLAGSTLRRCGIPPKGTVVVKHGISKYYLNDKFFIDLPDRLTKKLKIIDCIRSGKINDAINFYDPTMADKNIFNNYAVVSGYSSDPNLSTLFYKDLDRIASSLEKLNL
jgi:hypothetical protein